ncbi:MAG: SAM-dependent methyltransferase [Pseudomonadota bacterium]
MAETPILTDRVALDHHRARAIKQPSLFLHEEAAFEIEERLAEVNKSYNEPVLVGHVTEPFRRMFPGSGALSDTNNLNLPVNHHDLVLHLFGLHWADDPVGQIVQSRMALKPDGLFIAVLFGGSTLQELRAVLAETETRLTGGLSPRVVPMADLRDFGALLHRGGLALPVADSRKLKVRYPSLKKLVSDLRGMGETNALAARHRAHLPKHFFDHVEELYLDRFSEDGYLIASFELVFLTGWAPDESQPQPLRPGTAKARLADALGVSETPLERE